MALVPIPPYASPLLVNGQLNRLWRNFFTGLYEAVGGRGGDKVAAAYDLAVGAAPQSTQIIAGAGLYGADDLVGNASIALYKYKTSVANLGATNNIEGEWAYATNGRKPGEGAGSGTGVPCFWSNGNWIAVTSGVAVTA